MKRSIIAVLALVAIAGCRSSQKDRMDPNVATSVTNVPAPAATTVADAKGTTPSSAALPTPEPAVKVENIPMASAAATTTTTTKPHKKVRKD